MDFIERLRSLGPIHGKLISLDVTSLFTNVPIDFVLNNLKEAAESNIFSPPIPIDEFCELIRICVDATVFTFDNQVYKQKFGVAMGSPLSPILANLCLEFLEKQYIQTMPDNIKPILWVRYVDDIFIIYQQDEEAFNEMLHRINNILPTIKFTVEQEVDGAIPFLDVYVIHDKYSNEFRFKVYRKQTNAENYIHFFSSHSPSVKDNIVSNMFSRALKICDPLYLKEELDHIFKTFFDLGYPLHFLEKCLSKAKRKYYLDTPPVVSEEKRVSLPYSPGLLSVQKTINNINNKEGEKKKVNITFKYNNTLRSKLVRNRDKIISKEGVYCIPCLDCSQCYVGETGRDLDVRLEEHRSDCRLGKNYSAVAHHSLDVGHRIGFKKSEIVYKCHDRQTRRTVEGALIGLNKTFHNNKGFNSESRYINSTICQALKIRNYNKISATLSTAASPLLPQVPVIPDIPGLLGTGAYAENPDNNIPPEPPDIAQGGQHPNDGPRRRSERIRNR